MTLSFSKDWVTLKYFVIHKKSVMKLKDLVCPISSSTMLVPVAISTGQTYDYMSLFKHWFASIQRV